MDEHDDNSSSRTVEDWAERKGLLPEFTQIPARMGQFLVAGRRQNPEFVKFAQARALRGWPEGAEVTEAEFDAAVAEGQGISLR